MRRRSEAREKGGILIKRTSAPQYAAFLLLIGCGGGGASNASVTPPVDTTVARVNVTPANATLTVNSTLQFVATPVDASGNPVAGHSVTWASNDAAVASVNGSGLVTGVSVGSAMISASSEGKTGTASLTVAPLPSGPLVDLQPGVTYQTIIGWQGSGNIGQYECNSTAYGIYKTTVLDRLVSDVGINRVSVDIRPEIENPVDYFLQYRSGQLTFAQWKSNWFISVNDNADSRSANLSGFQYGLLDFNVDEVIVPLRQRLQARGEKLYFIVTFVDFNSSTYEVLADPEEYAELITVTFQHLQQKYGFVPDGLEILNEPDNTPWGPAQLGAAIVAVGNRLKTAGFSPAIIAPSTTSMAASVQQYYPQMKAVPGVSQYLTDLSYHRYTANSDPALAQIGQTASQDHIRSAMLEHIGSGYEDLYKDLTLGMVSSWEQYGLAFCGNQDNLTTGGVYLQINQSTPSSPRVNFPTPAKYLSQYFRYVRAGAVRIGATSSSATFEPVAFRNTSGKYVVVVKANGGGAFSVRGLPAGTYGITYTTGETTYNVPHPDATISAGGLVSTSIPTVGVITIFAR